MFVEMTCACTASIQVELKEHQETMGLILVNRFTNAHVDCGFMSSVSEERTATTKKFDIKTTEQDK
jgi:hypothetical protein